jgi:hypothetical protein
MRCHHRSSRRRKQSHWQQGGRQASQQIKEQWQEREGESACFGWRVENDHDNY